MKTRVFFISLLIAFICPVLFAQAYTINQMTNPDPNNNNLMAVWAYDNSNIFAGGANETFLKYNGTSWTKIPISFSFTVQSIYGTSPTDVWLIDILGSLAHYNGVTVTKVDIGNTNYLFKIFGFSANDIYLCGWNGTIRHYDGSNWNPVSNPYSNIGFNSMWGTSGSDLYFCGNDANAPYTARIIHYDGSGFTELKSLADASFTNIWSSDNNLFYVSGGDGLYLYNKTSNDISLIGSGSISALYGFDASNILVSKLEGSYDSLAVFNGSIWKSYVTNCAMNSICSPTNNPNNVFLVGDNGVILHVDLTTDIPEVETLSQFNVYPNPSNGGDIYIDLDFKQNTKATVAVLNSVGQQVQTITSNEFLGKESLKIDGGLAVGVYFIKVSTAVGNYNRKIVITK